MLDDAPERGRHDGRRGADVGHGDVAARGGRRHGMARGGPADAPDRRRDHVLERRGPVGAGGVAVCRGPRPLCGVRRARGRRRRGPWDRRGRRERPLCGVVFVLLHDVCDRQLVGLLAGCWAGCWTRLLAPRGDLPRRGFGGGRELRDGDGLADCAGLVRLHGHEGGNRTEVVGLGPGDSDAGQHSFHGGQMGDGGGGG